MTGQRNGSQNMLARSVRSLQGTVAQLKTRMGPQPTGQNGNTAGRRRRAQRRQLAQNANLRSIPRAIAPKLERFARGTPTTSHHFAPRGQGYYDAFACLPDALVMASQVGPCTPIEGFTRVSVTGGAGVNNLSYEAVTGQSSLMRHGLTDNTSLIVFNPGSSDATVCRIYKLKTGTNGNAEVEFEEVGVTAFAELGPTRTAIDYEDLQQAEGNPQMVQGPDGRIESIPVRGSLRIRNVTENLAVGGEIRILRYNGGLHLGHDPLGVDALSATMGVAEYLNICDMIRDTKRTHSLDGHEVKATHQSNTYPADHVRSMTFSADKSFDECVHTPSFCSLLILVDNFRASASQVNNTYSIGMTVHRAARFKPGSLLHNKAVVPASHQPTHAVHAQKEALQPAMSPLKAITNFINSPFADPLMKAGMRGISAASRGGGMAAIAEDILGFGAYASPALALV